MKIGTLWRQKQGRRACTSRDAELFRLLVSTVRDYAIFVLDDNGCVVTWNDGAVRIQGYQLHEIVAKHFRTLFAHEDASVGKPEHLLHLARREGRVVDQGWRIRKDGSRFLCNSVLTQLMDDSGRPAGFAAIARDITEHERAEEAERERAALAQAQAILDRVHAFAANIPGLAYRRVLHADGTVEYPFVAGQYVQLVGFAANPALANGADLLAVTHKDDRERLRAAMDISASELAPLNVEGRMLLVSGEARWMRSRSTPRRGRDGSVIWDAIAFDITEQRNLENRLRLLQTTSLAVAEAEDFTSALRVVIQAVCTATDWDYGEAWVPHPARTKLKLGPVWHNGRESLARFADISRSIAMAPGEGFVGTAWQRGAVWVDELATWPNPHPERTRAGLAAGIKSISAVPITVEKEVLAVMSFAAVRPRARDEGFESTITTLANQLGIALQRKRAEQALREKEGQLAEMQKMKALAGLTGGMAHDFNNLLGVIIGNLDLLDEALTGDCARQVLVAEALAAAVRGADLIRSLLAFARRQPLQPEPLRVGEHVAEIAKLLRRTVGEEIEIIVDIDADPWPVVADRAQLESAITNLATNARDAMPNGGRLTISVTRAKLDHDYANAYPDLSPGDYTMISVTDTGFGIPPEALTHVFEPFFTTKEPGSGTGLGLSMVFGFIKQSGGHVSVCSKLGIGTTFRLYLPRAAGIREQRPAPAMDQPRHGAGELILVVEDNPHLRHLLERQLRELGYDVILSDNARTALDILESNRNIKLLLTDIIMPGGITGIDLAREAMQRWPQVRVLLTSGFPHVSLVSVELGGLELSVLTKPYRSNELARAIGQALEPHVPLASV